MEDLNDTDMASGAWLKKFEKLRHDYEHHIDEEESEVFDRARKVIPQDQIAGYGDRFKARKEDERALVARKRKDSLED